MPEGPLGHMPALLPRLFVREAEMDAVVDANIDGIYGHVREAMIRARLRVSQRVGGGDCEGHVIRPEEECERAGQGANNVIKARGIVRIRRGSAPFKFTTEVRIVPDMVPYKFQEKAAK